MKRIERQKQKLKRKNFFPLFIITLAFWLGITSFVYFVSPESYAAILGFFVLLGVTLFLTMSILFGNTRRGIIISASILLFLFLRFIGVGNVINLVLILGIAVTMEIFFYKT